MEKIREERRRVQRRRDDAQITKDELHHHAPETEDETHARHLTEQKDDRRQTRNKRRWDDVPAWVWTLFSLVVGLSSAAIGYQIHANDANTASRAVVEILNARDKDRIDPLRYQDLKGEVSELKGAIVSLQSEVIAGRIALANHEQDMKNKTVTVYDRLSHAPHMPGVPQVKK
jgi:hypothetical protein